jgi:hypothetical protein
LFHQPLEQLTNFVAGQPYSGPGLIAALSARLAVAIRDQYVIGTDDLDSLQVCADVEYPRAGPVGGDVKARGKPDNRSNSNRSFSEHNP